METQYCTVGELPDEFLKETVREFAPYSVSLSRIRNNDAKTFLPLGSGVLVDRNGRFGILTAYHCLHSCNPEVNLTIGSNEMLVLMINRRTISLSPNEVFEHVLAKPLSVAFGPDLIFLEIAGEKKYLFSQ